MNAPPPRIPHRPGPASLCLCWAVLILGSGTGCDPNPEGAPDSMPAASVPSPAPAESPMTIIHLDAQQIVQAGLEIRRVTRGEFRTHRDFPGTVQPNQRVLAEITPLVRGRVVDVYADLGQNVAPGTLLAMLYSSDLGIAQSAYLKAIAKLHVSEHAFERAKLLPQEKVIGRGEYQRREGEMISARAETREARDQLRLLGMSEDTIRRLEDEQSILSYIPILAPFAGQIIVRDLAKGEVVEATNKLFVIADLSEVWVVADIPEKDIPFIHRDQSARPQSVEVLVSAYPSEAFQAKITYVGDVLDPTTRAMRLRLELPNPERRLMPEMFARARIYSEPEPNVLMIPKSSVQRNRNQLLFFVQPDRQSFEVRDVRIGESNGDMVKALGGLRDGETIVAKGTYLLKSQWLKNKL